MAESEAAHGSPLGAASTDEASTDEASTDEASTVVIALIDQSAAVALEHASELQARLRSLQPAADPEIDAAREQAHLLLVDIVSLRNAAELLKRGLDQAV